MKRSSGGRMYPRELQKEHSEQMDMWRQMERTVDESTEETFAGVLEAAHAAIAENFESTEGRLLNNGEISRIVEKVVEWSGPVHLRSFYFKLTGSICYLLKQRAASRVLEKLFKRAHQSLEADTVTKDTDEEDATRLPTLKALLNGTVDEIIAGDVERSIALIDLVQEPCSSFALRVLVYVLSGRAPPEKNQKRGGNDLSAAPAALGTALHGLGAAVTKAVAADGIFANRCRDPAVAGLLDVLVSVWPQPEPLLNVVTGCVDSLLANNVSSRVVESCLQNAEGHARLHEHFLANWQRLSRTSVHAVAKWLAYAPTEAVFSEALESIAKERASLQQGGQIAIFVGAAEGGQAHPGKRSAVVELIEGAYGSLKALAATLLGMTNTKAGTVMLSRLLSYNYNDAPDVFFSIAELPQWQVKELSSSNDGSIMLENFVKNSKPRELKKFTSRLTGSFVDIATASVAGAMLVEKLFEASGLAIRRSIAAEMAGDLKRLESAWYGKKTIGKLRLDQFAHRNDDWEEAEKRVARKDKLLKSILGADAGADPSSAPGKPLGTAAAGPAPAPAAPAGKQKGKKKGKSEGDNRSLAQLVCGDAPEAEQQPAAKGKKDKKDKKKNKAKAEPEPPAEPVQAVEAEVVGKKKKRRKEAAEDAPTPETKKAKKSKSE
ncbi:Nucleolar protein 9 [Diplonema papillatum]|nr:Nucleolar protein 9 [Diplonema papillatum]